MAKKKKDEAPEAGIRYGPLVTAGAELAGVDIETFTCKMLYNAVDLPTTDKMGNTTNVTFLPGNTLGGRRGPDLKKPSKVVIIGKMPWREEQSKRELFVGPSGELIREVLSSLNVEYDDWYTTNVVRFMPPYGAKTLKAAWLKECKPLLDAELALLEPEFILLLGADAVKAVMGKGSSLKKFRGATNLTYNGARVLVTTHPAAVLKSPELRPGFERDFRTFVGLVRGDGTVPEAAPVNYEEITSVWRLTEVVDGILAEWEAHPDQPKRLGVDCEWGGLNGADYLKGKLRTIQFSPASHRSYCVILRRCGLLYDPDTCCEEKAAVEQLKRIMCLPDVQIGGHNFRGDLKWLKRYGIDCSDQFFKNGVDTMLMYHMRHPAAEGHALENLAVRFTDMGRYDLPVKQWLSENGYTSQSKTKKSDSGKRKMRKHGFAFVPDELLNPVYAPADTDVVMRCWDHLKEQLQAQAVTHPYELLPGVQVRTLWDLYQYVVQPCGIPLHEVETVGVYSDSDRMKRLTELFVRQRDAMVSDFQTEIKWPLFNFRSVDNVREFLFSRTFGKEPKRPEGAMTLSLYPIKTTEKPSRDWGRVPIEDIDKNLVFPSTDAEVLQIYGAEHPLAEKLQKLRFVDQIIKNFLRPPEPSKETGELEWNGGLVYEVDHDKRIRTSVSQLTDTGRYKSSEPNLQNLPKKQEAELIQIFSTNLPKLLDTHGWGGMQVQELKDLGLLNPGYYSLRSCLQASPGHILIEADYVQAELQVLAHLSGDPDMIAVMSDSSRDLHSEMAVTAFNLGCAPNEVKKLHPKQRVMAKNVNFGIAYGRGANALVRQAMTEGVEADSAKMQMLINNFFEKFPKVRDYVTDCHAAVIDPGYVENAYGRRRYFYPTKDSGTLKSQERQAQNMPIQGTVADALSVALYNVFLYRAQAGMKFKIVLPVHDAIFLDTPLDEVDQVLNEVLPLCMTKSVRIPNTKLHINIDTEVMRRWSEKMKLKDAIEEAKLELKNAA